jgi:PadR family transcriptional regulator PadR
MEGRMAGIRGGRLYGHLDLLILKILGRGEPLHGLAIADGIQQASLGEITIEEGALYPALHRLQRAGLIQGEWRVSTKRYRARFYDLTPRGERELERALAEWTRHTGAVGRVLEIAWEELS